MATGRTTSPPQGPRRCGAGSARRRKSRTADSTDLCPASESPASAEDSAEDGGLPARHVEGLRERGRGRGRLELHPKAEEWELLPLLRPPCSERCPRGSCPPNRSPASTGCASKARRPDSYGRGGPAGASEGLGPRTRNAVCPVQGVPAVRKTMGRSWWQGVWKPAEGAASSTDEASWGAECGWPAHPWPGGHEGRALVT